MRVVGLYPLALGPFVLPLGVPDLEGNVRTGGKGLRQVLFAAHGAVRPGEEAGRTG